MGPKDYINPLYENGVRIDTPRAKIDCNENESERMTNTDVLEFTIKPVRGLIIKSQNSYMVYQRHDYQFWPSYLPKRTEGEGADAYRYEGDARRLTSENTVSYSKKFASGHYFDAMAGFSATHETANFFLAEGRRVAHRRPEVEQHEQHRQQGELQRFDQLEQSRARVGAHAPELQLQEPLLLHLHGALRRVVELRREQQMGFLPFGGRQVERQEREFPQAGALAR